MPNTATISLFAYSRGGQLGAQGHLWPFTYFSVALLMIKISKHVIHILISTVQV